MFQFICHKLLKSTGMKYFFIVLTLMSAVNARAQTAEDSVKSVIQNMFTAMKNADGPGLMKCFGDSALLQTIGRTKEGVMFVKTDGPAVFADQISKSVKGSLDERITFETIKADGPLAIAWTPYNFYYNGQFSHCGVNSFQVVRFNGVWKIQYVIDTRRRQDCKPE